MRIQSAKNMQKDVYRCIFKDLCIFDMKYIYQTDLSNSLTVSMEGSFSSVFGSFFLFRHTFGIHPPNRLQRESFHGWRTVDCLRYAISGCVVTYLDRQNGEILKCEWRTLVSHPHVSVRPSFSWQQQRNLCRAKRLNKVLSAIVSGEMSQIGTRWVI